MRLMCNYINYNAKEDFIVEFAKTLLNPNWHEGGYFYLLVLFGSDFVS
jgi:hypothetical protein